MTARLTVIVVVLGIAATSWRCAGVLESSKTVVVEPAHMVASGQPAFRVRVAVRAGDEARAQTALDALTWQMEEASIEDVTFLACVTTPRADPSIVRLEMLGRCAHAAAGR